MKRRGSGGLTAHIRRTATENQADPQPTIAIDPSVPIQGEADIPIGMMREYYRLRGIYSRPLNPQEEEEEIEAEEAEVADEEYERLAGERRAYRTDRAGGVNHEEET